MAQFLDTYQIWWRLQKPFVRKLVGRFTPEKMSRDKITPQNANFQGYAILPVLCETSTRALPNPLKMGFPSLGGRKLQGGPKNRRPPIFQNWVDRKFFYFNTMWLVTRPIILGSLAKIEDDVFEKLVKTRKSKNPYVRNFDPRVI